MTIPLPELREPKGLPPGPTFTLSAFAEWYGVTNAEALAVLARARKAGVVHEVVVGGGARWRRAT